MVCGMKSDTGFTCSEVSAKAFLRTISVPEHKTLFYKQIDAKGAIKDHPTALKDAYEVGKRLVK